jgi:excisionase family DNA binding protein
MLTPDEVAVMSGISTRAIYRLVEEGRIHFTETEDGSVLVCVSSRLDPTGADWPGSVS